MAEEKRRIYSEPLYSFKPVAPLPPNTLTNADGTPYQAGYDEQVLGQIAYEAFVNAPGYQAMLHKKFGAIFAPAEQVRWEQLLPEEQRVWQEVAEAVKARL